MSEYRFYRCNECHAVIETNERHIAVKVIHYDPRLPSGTEYQYDEKLHFCSGKCLGAWYAKNATRLDELKPLSTSDPSPSASSRS